MQSGGNRQNPAENPRYFVGLGANLPSRFGAPLETLLVALEALEARQVSILARSPWFESEPVPKSDQPWFINGVICISTLETPSIILKILHEIEINFGRVRSVANAARPLDLDLLAAADHRIVPARAPKTPEAGAFDLTGAALVLPHPRLTERAFVLKPLAAIAPDWVPPGAGRTVAELAAGLPESPVVRPMQG